MTQVADDQTLGQFARRTHDWFERVRKGSLDPNKVYEAVKFLLAEADIGKLVEYWHQYYKDIFSVDASFLDLVVPERQSGFGWIIIPTPLVPLNIVWQEGCKFPCYSYWGDDLESVFLHTDARNDRIYTDRAYIVRARNRPEADEELKGKSANQLQQENVAGITIDERIRLESFYWWKTGGKNGGKHLDINNITLCSGSRDSRGSVPDAGWGDDEFCVDCYNPDDAGGDLRARQVISSAR